MQSRCCWPPERPDPRRLEPVLHLVPEAGADQRFTSPILDLARGRAGQAQARGDVVETDIVGNGFGFWKTMPTARRTATTSIARVVEIDPVEQDLALRRGRPAISSCMRLMQRTIVDFPQPEGPMIAVTLHPARSRGRRPGPRGSSRSRHAGRAASHGRGRGGRRRGRPRPRGRRAPAQPESGCEGPVRPGSASVTAGFRLLCVVHRWNSYSVGVQVRLPFGVGTGRRRPERRC